jgi:hypothetical protein
MQCTEFRHQAGADPRHLGPEARAHAGSCPQCAVHLAGLLALDERILAALRVDVSASAGVVRPLRRTGGIQGLDRRRWMALAASIVGGVLVGTLLWVGGPRDSLAADLIEHLDHEPHALVATNRPEEEAVLGEVLERGGIRLRPGEVLVSYANSCPFRGHTVPHLVVQTTDGPVTVMVLRSERPAASVSFDEQGHAGRIVPAGPGSIAVIGADGTDLEEITSRVLAAVEWLGD